jgi:hypothetical protein
MTRLERFENAMETLYGPLDAIDDPSQWTPPPGSGGHRGRYLWTDAFGVVNFVTLYKIHATMSTLMDDPKVVTPSIASSANAPRSEKYLVLARRLVQTVHDVLGRTRDGQSRLPGATDANPLGGGLRIGKVDGSGPDGDGQYHHYLTIWMFALNRLSLATGDPSYNSQAIALAQAIHPHFVFNRQSGNPQMAWKMTMDLSMALVPTEGNLDPIDGYVVFRLLRTAAQEFGNSDPQLLEAEIADYQLMMERRGVHQVSCDPLDLGMTLWTAHWFADNETWARNLADNCLAQICTIYPVSLPPA